MTGRTPAAPALEVQNEDSVENFGADIDITLRTLEGLVDPGFEGLRLNFRIGWLESPLIDFSDQRVFRSGIGDPIPVTVDFTGNRLPNAAQKSANEIVEWAFDGVGAKSPRNIAYVNECGREDRRRLAE